MSPQDEHCKDWQVYSVCILHISCFTSTTVCSRNINKQNVNIADETLTDYSFLGRCQYTKSKNYLKRRYRICHWIPMFIGTPFNLTEMREIVVLNAGNLNQLYSIKKKLNEET